MLRFGWDFKKLESEKKIGMVDAVYQRVESEMAEQESLQSILYNLRSKLSEVKILVEQLGATRLVVDSLPGFGFRVTDLNTLREIFLEVGLLLKDVGCTTLMTTEIVEGSGLISRYGIEEFLATGVMVLSLVKQSSPLRKLFVRKMRGTSHSLNDFAFTIGTEGVNIKGPIGVRSASHGSRRLHSAEAVDSGFEEIVTGTVPVSDGSEVVEQGVQGQAQAIDQQSFTGEDQGQRRQRQV